jgi:hypothetical protein
LNAGFYADVVGPLLGEIPHCAAHLGYGSDVLGFDTERSTDHGWGPRLYVFVGADDAPIARTKIDAGLPEAYRGWPVRFGWDAVPVTHHVAVVELDHWLTSWLGWNPRAGETTLDWLVTPQQLLLGVVGGAVYHDPSADLTSVRAQLAYYPTSVRLWMLACQWQRIQQEEAFVGRAAEVGDELGSRLLTGRIVRELMRAHFLLAGRYWPYNKWFGSAYRALPGARELLPLYDAALGATPYRDREAALATAYETVARMHNDSGLTQPVDPSVRSFYERGFQVLMAERFVQACLDALDDEWLREQPLIGAIDQYVDSTDILVSANLAQRLRQLYGRV